MCNLSMFGPTWRQVVWASYGGLLMKLRAEAAHLNDRGGKGFFVFQ